MRANRISDILFASVLASAAALVAAPASAQTPYDGLWQVTVVTKTGSCDAQTTSTVNVADGKISGGPVSGSVGSGVGVGAKVGACVAVGSTAAWLEPGTAVQAATNRHDTRRAPRAPENDRCIR